MLSGDGRIKDYGRGATQLFPRLSDRSAIGEPLPRALPELADALREEDSLLEQEGEASPRYYRIVETDVGGGMAQGSRVVVFSDITERERRERALRDRQEKVEALYAAVNRLLRVRREEEVGDLILRLVNDVLGFPLVGVRLAKDGRLVPVQTSPEVDQYMPDRSPVQVDGDSIIAQAYRKGAPLTFDDLRAVDDPADYGKARGAAVFPMSEHGTIVVGDLQAGPIDDFDRRLIEVLSAHATVVLDRLDQESTLRAAKEEAEEASRMKSALLANMSHEIRTPLTSIIGFAETIGEEAESLRAQDPDVEFGPIGRFAGLIENSGRRLLGTLDAVLNLSKLEGENVYVDGVAVDLAAEAEEVAEQFLPQAEDATVDLRVDIEETPLHVQADQEGLRIALRNLISNAIKYTEPGGDVWLRVRPENGKATLEVEDTGVGMDPEQTDELFEPFRQESEGFGREYEGTGLGLALTKRAIDQMGGTIDVETAKGEGSQFIVRLPRPEADSEG